MGSSVVKTGIWVLTVLWCLVCAATGWYFYANLKLTVRTQSERFNKVIRRRDERWKEGIYDDDVGGSVLSMQNRIEDSLRNMTDSYAPLAFKKRATSARYAKDLFTSHVRERGTLSDDDRLIKSSNYTHTQIYKIKSTPKDRQRRRRAQLRRRERFTEMSEKHV